VTALALSAASALVMTGVIWFVQLVHYPLFERVGEPAWSAYHAGHTARTGVLVAPLMVLELATAAWLALVDRPGGVSGGLALAGLLLAAATWALTLGVASPDHGRLAERWRPELARRLVTIGWARTAAWTAHGAVALVMLAQA
jgi:hypothetical protein